MLFKDFFLSDMTEGLCEGVCITCVSRAHSSGKSIGSPEIRVTQIIESPAGVLGSEAWSTARAAWAPN